MQTASVFIMKQFPLKPLFAVTLAFSILLEFYVRWVSVWVYGIDGFGMFPPIDNIMHFLWGLNIFFIFVLLLRFEPIDAIFAVFAFQMVWEASEMIGDVVLAQPSYMLDHFFFDGIKDTVFDIAGAGAGWLIFLKSSAHIRFRKITGFRRFMTVYSWAIALLAVIGFAYFILVILSRHAFISPDLAATAYIIIGAPASYALNKALSKAL
jgi:hypothetical protein